MLVLESPARSAPAAGSPHMLAGIPQQRLALGPTCPCRALRRQRRNDAADTRPQSHRPRRSRRRARGRISSPFLPAQSSSTQAPLPTRTEVHATRGRVYSLDSELRLPACGTDNNSHSPIERKPVPVGIGGPRQTAAPALGNIRETHTVHFGLSTRSHQASITPTTGPPSNSPRYLSESRPGHRFPVKAPSILRNLRCGIPTLDCQ